MIKSLIYDKLIKLRNKKQHDVIKLRWQKAELERLLAEAKRKQEEDR